MLIMLLAASSLATKALTVSVTTDKTVYKLGEEIHFKVKVTNTSSKILNLRFPTLDYRSTFFGFAYEADKDLERTYYPIPASQILSSLRSPQGLKRIYNGMKIKSKEQYIIRLGSFPISNMLKERYLKFQLLKPGKSIEKTISIYAVRPGKCKVKAYFTGYIKHPGLWQFSKYTASDPVQIEIKGKEIRVIMQTTEGPLNLRLRPNLALNHVYHFVNLSKKGFYNDVFFHRVIKGFMVQGGDPNAKKGANPRNIGKGDPGYYLPAEFSSQKHIRGTLSAARTALYNTAGCQFFICTEPFSDSDKRTQASLNGLYTVFGRLSRSSKYSKTLRRLSRIPTIPNSNGKVTKIVKIISTKLVFKQ